MITCKKCKKKFKIWQVIDGKKRNLKGRKYCLSCSPFGQHNTIKLDGSLRKDQINEGGKEKVKKCKCGETDPSKFYGRKSQICSKCHNAYTLKCGQEKREKAIKYLGGCCKICGYDKYYGSIDLHHLNPLKKDKKFSQLRGWSWERIKQEIKDCVPLCRNCHGEVHAGIVKIGE